MRLPATWFCSVAWVALLGLPAQSPSAGAFPATPAEIEAVDEADVGEAGEECTVGVASGRATADGRPLLWKNRDAQKRDNVVTAFTDGKWPYVGICDAGSTSSVWGGANAAGFCIMNSVSRDLPQGSSKGPGNGGFMKLALRRCETVDDFEALLKETNDGLRRTRANFGVIDAHGGAAFFETGHKTYKRFDAAKAADGLLVRTNFATTGNGDRGRERFARAEVLCKKLPKDGKLDHELLLQQFCRDLQPPRSAEKGPDGQQDVRETIHRQTTVAAMVFHGCKPGEDARLTTMWAIVGQPLYSIAVPCFPAAEAVALELAGEPATGKPRSLLCDLALRLQDAFYATPPPPSRDGGDDVPETETSGAIRWMLVGELPALRAELLPAEKALLEATRRQVAEWRAAKQPPTAAQLLEFHAEQARAATRGLRTIAEKFVPAAAGR